MEKLKHVLLAGVVMISLVVFSVMYYTRANSVSKERIASQVLADSDEDEGDDDVEEDDVDEKDNEEEDNKDETEKEIEKVKKETEKAKKEENKRESSWKNKRTELDNITSGKSKKIKNNDEEDEDENEIDDDDKDDENEVDDDKEDSDEDEDKLEDEEEGEGTIVSKEVITNEDGTITRRLTLLKKDGRKKVIEHTFDANNKLVSKKKSEIRTDKGEEKIETESFDIYGEKISEYKMETKDGKRIEIKRKNSEGESKLKFNVEKNELMVKVKDGKEGDAKAFLKIKADENSAKVKLTYAGIVANSNFPITVDDETGKVYVKTLNKEVELKQMPDVIVEKAKQSKELDIVEATTLENDSRPSYALKGKKFEKFLGFYTVEIPSEVTYDADTGEKISVNIMGFKKMLSWLSF